MIDKHVATDRAEPRNPVSIAVNCRPYVSRANVRTADGVMQNYSIDGACIEAACPFRPGTILVVRMLCYPSEGIDDAAGDWPRSMGLAEVRWHQARETKYGMRHVMGLRYLA